MKNGSMWIGCRPEPDRKPGIAVCEHPGNWVNPACWSVIALFERVEDRDFVLKLHDEWLAAPATYAELRRALEIAAVNTEGDMNFATVEEQVDNWIERARLDLENEKRINDEEQREKEDEA